MLAVWLVAQSKTLCSSSIAQIVLVAEAGACMSERTTCDWLLTVMAGLFPDDPVSWETPVE